MTLVDTDIEAYAEDHTSRESPAVRELVNRSDHDLEHIDMLSGRVVGQLLAMLVHISGARRVLEIGTFTGYSAMRMAEALPAEGMLVTCEYNRRYEKLARRAFRNSPHGDKVTLRMGPALETIKTLEPSFDLVFLDADKKSYPAYYEALLPMLKAGGVMVIDNVLWGGKVLNSRDPKARAIDQLNGIIADDGRVEQVMLTVRDGVTVLRKK